MAQTLRWSAWVVAMSREQRRQRMIGVIPN
jgi:hypothetical protein